jgi:AraC-like DNA-binding protein
MRAAIDFLLAHDLKRKLRPQDLSRHLHLSTRRVHHLFHEHFGLSPGQIFKLRRMQKAKELLASTFDSVKEVMAAVGFNDLSHFVRDFKQIYGKSPSELRKESGTEGEIPKAS